MKKTLSLILIVVFNFSYNTIVSAMDTPLSRKLQQYPAYDQATATLEKKLMTHFFKVESEEFRIMIELVKRYQGYDDAIKAAQQGMASKDFGMRDDSLKLFIELFKKRQGYKEACLIAQEGIVNSDHLVRNQSFELFEELFRYSQGYNEAITAAQKGIIKQAFGVRIIALELYSSIILNVGPWQNLKLDALSVVKSYLGAIKERFPQINQEIGALATIEDLNSVDNVKKLFAVILKNSDSNLTQVQIVCASLLINLLDQGHIGDSGDTPYMLLKDLGAIPARIDDPENPNDAFFRFARKIWQQEGSSKYSLVKKLAKKLLSARISSGWRYTSGERAPLRVILS